MSEIITKEQIPEYEAFLQSHPKGHFAQSVLWAKQKPMWKWEAIVSRDENGKINQKTEDLVGPYELHDFFLYQIIRFGYHPAKILFLAEKAFAGEYDRATLLKWLKNFYRRFFIQQFKRSCLPDGPKVGALCLSPRSDWRMPTDAVSRIWMDEVEKL